MGGSGSNVSLGVSGVAEGSGRVGLGSGGVGPEDYLLERSRRTEEQQQ